LYFSGKYPIMIRKELAAIIFLALCCNSYLKAQTGEETLRRMYNRYAGKWYKTMTFVQQTGIYRNDTLQRSATWYEAAKFPHDLRIDNEDPRNGNATIYRKDSTYRFANGKLARVTAGTNPFIFFIGSLYNMPYESGIKFLQTEGFDLSKGYSTNWKERKTLVIGAVEGDTTSKQVWVDAEHLYVVRYIEKTRGTVMDVRMSKQVPLGGGWTETWVEFYFDGKLRQTEKYSDMKADRILDDRLFEPTHFGQVHWMQ
jgi:outer membrane lipoprotein-sorting protein